MAVPGSAVRSALCQLNFGLKGKVVFQLQLGFDQVRELETSRPDAGFSVSCPAQEEKEAQASARGLSRARSTRDVVARGGQGRDERFPRQRVGNGRRVTRFSERTVGLCLPGCSRAGL